MIQERNAYIMGANLDYVIAPYDKKSATNFFQDAQRRAASEDGDSYSGRINMLYGPIQWKDLKLEDENAAADYLDAKHNKDMPPWAISFYGKPSNRLTEAGSHELRDWSNGYLEKSKLHKKVIDFIESLPNQANFRSPGKITEFSFPPDMSTGTSVSYGFYPRVTRPDKLKISQSLIQEYQDYEDEYNKEKARLIGNSGGLQWAIGGVCRS